MRQQKQINVVPRRRTVLCWRRIYPFVCRTNFHDDKLHSTLTRTVRRNARLTRMTTQI